MSRKVFYYHLDQIGTPIDMTDAQGSSVWSVQYRAYGNVIKQVIEEVDNPLRFQGQYCDAETGLHYNRHRYYSPSTGRFTTIDPIGLAGGLNNYQYVPNPTGWVDPLGLAGQAVSGPCGCVSNSTAGNIERSFLGSSEGHRYAGSVSPGGTGTAFSGHGQYRFGSGDVIVPDGTSVTLPREGIRILDETGRYIEAGNWEGLAKAAAKNPRIADNISGMASWLPGSKVPNYTLSAPTNPPLHILENSTTVESATSLGLLLKPKMGNVQWAACTEF